MIKYDPSALGLEDYINENMEKRILNQYVVEGFHYKGRNKEPIELIKALNNFLFDENENNKVLLLIGDAGSGKSFALQSKFINEVNSWSPKRPLPIYFNSNYNPFFEESLLRLNSILSSNIRFEEMEDEQIHIYCDFNIDEILKNVGKPIKEVIRENIHWVPHYVRQPLPSKS